MGEASEMSMSMSVQSAWEDLVVENPNRAKLEGCLLTTIMLVVCCIIALLVYVFVQLQPQGNVGLRPPYWKTTFYDDPPNRQFAIRMIGWINWTATRCKDFSGWACGGRGIEASSLAIGETSETAAEDYAMEYAIELIDRNMRLHKDEPNSGDFVEEEKYDFRGMTSVLKQCRRGKKTAKQFKDSLQAAWDSSWTARLGMIPVSEGGQVVNMLKSFHDDLHFFPLGDQYYTAKTAGGTESDILTDGYKSGMKDSASKTDAGLVALPQKSCARNYAKRSILALSTTGTGSFQCLYIWASGSGVGVYDGIILRMGLRIRETSDWGTDYRLTYAAQSRK